MKSVLVCAAQAPFVTGGAEIHVRELVVNLRRRGFRVDVVKVPFHGFPPSEVVRQALAWRLLELRETTGRAPDLVIPTKFPSYLVRHHRKVAWVFHQYREAYDLLGTPHSALTEDPEDRRVVAAVRAMDDVALGECRAIFANSRNVAKRLARFNRLPAEPLHPPPQRRDQYHAEEYGDYLLCSGRLERMKRPDLVLRAVARVRSARVRITGEGPLRSDLERLAVALGVAHRVDFLGFVPETDLVTLYARCRAAIYVPEDEDYGYVTVESFLSRKPVITTSDAGGPLEFVEDAVNGYVAAPEAEALAERIDRLFSLPESRLREMGEAGYERVASISWDRVVDRLTESIR
jgi:glycosyltransferase involved in cell wall biosynthesis